MDYILIFLLGVTVGIILTCLFTLFYLWRDKNESN